MPMDWGALAGAIVDTQNGWLNFISQGMANRTNRQNVIDANNQNAALAEQANQWNIDQWNRVNAYNDPSAQRARLVSAGLNPALVYGQGGITNEAPSMPGANVANMQAASAMAPQLPLIGSQVALNLAQANKLKAETETEDQMRQAAYDNLVAQTNNLAASTDHLRESISNMVKSRELTGEQIESLKFDRIMKDKQYGLDVKRLNNETAMTKSQIRLNNASIQKILSEKNVTDRQYAEMVYTFAVRYAGLEAQVGLTQAKMNEALATARNLGLKSDMLEGSASAEKYFAEALNGQHGVDQYLIAQLRSGIQMVTRDFGNILGVFK